MFPHLLLTNLILTNNTVVLQVEIMYFIQTIMNKTYHIIFINTMFDYMIDYLTNYNVNYSTS
jgi:hypothetical protein